MQRVEMKFTIKLNIKQHLTSTISKVNNLKINNLSLNKQIFQVPDYCTTYTDSTPRSNGSE